MKDLLNGVFLLASGAVTARVVGILAIPILTRLYSPEQFGVLALYTSVLQILLPFATFRYLMAIPLPRQDHTAFTLLTLSVGLALVFSLLLLVLYLATGPLLFDVFSLSAVAPYAWLVPLGVFGASVYETFTMWGIRKRAYRVIARTQIWQSVTGEGLKLLLGVIWARPIGLLLGHMVGQAGGLRFLVSRYGSEMRCMATRLRWRHVRIVAHRFRGFPIYRMPAQFLLAAALQAPLLLVAAFYDTKTTGQMGLAMTAFTLPFALIGQAASRAYYAETARFGADGIDQIMEALKKTTLTLGLLSVPVAVVLVLFGEVGATIVLGDAWAQAGRFVALLGIALVPQFVSSTVVRTLDVIEAHRIVVMLNLTRLALVSAAFVFSARAGASADDAVLAFSLVLALHYLLQVAVIFCVVLFMRRGHS